MVNIGTLLALARTLKLKQIMYQVSHVWTTFSHSNLHDMTHSSVEISEDGMQLLEYWVTLHLYVCMYKCGEAVAHASFSPNIV